MDEVADDFDRPDVLPAGSAIGSYTVRRVIGHGGFGITYEAHNRVTGRAMAIKEFFPSGMARRDGQSRLICSADDQETVTLALGKFEETAIAVAGLDHPNIVQVYDYVPLNNTGYIIMELLDGQTLENWLKMRPVPPQLDELRPLLDPVMAALGYVHGRGLVHRDIAPDNILITREGRPVLIGFGTIRRDLRDAPRSAMSRICDVFHYFYVAPEQLRLKARPTVEANVYAMGAVLYRALTGAEPADGQERIDNIFLISTDPYQPLADRPPPGCSAHAAQAIDAALAVNPKDRIQTMAELRAALDASVLAAISSRTAIVERVAAALRRISIRFPR